MKGRLFIVSGPSGSGKDTVLKRLLAVNRDIFFSISTVTRQMRTPEETDKYNFTTVEQFKNMILNNELLEYNEYCGNFYGTPIAPVKTAIENGKKNICKKCPEAVTVFIMPPSVAILKERLSGRGTEKTEIIEKRMTEAMREIKDACNYDYVIINDKLEDAVNNMQTIIDADKLKTERNIEFLEEVYKLC